MMTEPTMQSTVQDTQTQLPDPDKRSGRGSLTEFWAAEDWDSAETNAGIAQDFAP